MNGVGWAPHTESNKTFPDTCLIQYAVGSSELTIKNFLTLTFLLAQPSDELLGCDRTDFLLLSGDAVEQVCETRQQRLLGTLVAGLVLQDLVSERLAEVQRL